MAGPKHPEHPMHDTDGDVAVQEGKPKLKEPRQFAVLLHNDDYTTMEFVIEVLQKFFKHEYEAAHRITMEVHLQGRGVAGVYSHQIAETKAAQVIDYAKDHGFPLKATAEPV